MKEQILVIGGVALGPKAASRLKRLNPEAEVTLIDKDEYISYGGCGIPYYISGEVQSIDALRSTVAHVIRDPDFFENIKNVHVRTKVEAKKILPQEKKVLVFDEKTQKEEYLSYDKLVLGLGAKPRPLTISGADLKGVSALTNLHEANAVHEFCASGKVKKAVVIGAGFIGIEVAIALADMWGIETTIIEVQNQVLPGVVSPHIAKMAQKDLEDLGINIHTSESVQKLEGKEHVAKVFTDKRELEAQLVIVSIGFIPNTQIAKEAGLECIGNNAIVVDKHMRTSDPNIYAGGDCCSVKNLITGKQGYLPLGSLANRQGRVIGSNLAGRKDTFEGYVGTWAVKLHKMNAVGVGLSIEKAKQEGFDAISVSMEGDDRAHFYPDANMTSLEIVVEKSSRRILGIQGFSSAGDALKARIDVVAVLMQQGKVTIDELSNAEVAYAPPFASAMDIINTIANVADNVLEGRLNKLDSSEFVQLWENRKENNVFFVDARPPHKPTLAIQEKYPDYWHVIPLEELKNRIHEIPKEKPLALICSSGLRSYETLLSLKKAGYTHILGSSLGGMQALKKRGDDIK